MFLGAGSVSAQDPTSTLTERIATRFNLNEAEVDRVFDEFHEEKQADREARVSKFLQKKVEEGVITEEQKTLVEEKRAEVFESILEIKEQDIDHVEKVKQIKQVHEEFVSWAKENDIPIKDLKPDHFKGHGHKFPKEGHRKF